MVSNSSILCSRDSPIPMIPPEQTENPISFAARTVPVCVE